MRLNSSKKSDRAGRQFDVRRKTIEIYFTQLLRVPHGRLVPREAGIGLVTVQECSWCFFFMKERIEFLRIIGKKGEKDDVVGNSGIFVGTSSVLVDWSKSDWKKIDSHCDGDFQMVCIGIIATVCFYCTFANSSYLRMLQSSSVAWILAFSENILYFPSIIDYRATTTSETANFAANSKSMLLWNRSLQSFRI